MKSAALHGGFPDAGDLRARKEGKVIDHEDLKKLERKLREYNELDWVLVANVMTEAATLGRTATEDTAFDRIARLHEQGKIRVGTHINDASGGFTP